MTQQETSERRLSLADLPDPDLVDAMAAGDVDAMEVLYERYNRAVFSFAYRILGDRERAEEILQEVFLRAWRSARKFSEGRGAFITWLLSITHNMAIDDIRKHNRRPRKAESADPLHLLGNMRDDTPAVEDQAILGHVRDVIREALATLPEAQRMAIELAYFHGYTQREIAETLDEPLGTIKTRMRLAIRKLRECLESQGLETP